MSTFLPTHILFFSPLSLFSLLFFVGGNNLFRSAILAEMTSNLPSVYVANELLGSAHAQGFVRSAKKQQRDKTNRGAAVLSAGGHSAVVAVQRGRAAHMDPEYVDFFLRNCISKLQSQGKVRETVVLPVTKQKLMRRLFQEMPALVRSFRDRVGAEVSTRLTTCVANVKAATWMEEQPGFTPEQEQHERGLMFDIRQHATLTARRVFQRKLVAKDTSRFSTTLSSSTVSGCAGPVFISGPLPSLGNYVVFFQFASSAALIHYLQLAATSASFALTPGKFVHRTCARGTCSSLFKSD
jgi:hypothetical protein